MTTPAPPPLPDVKALLANAAQANKDHQYALKVYTERLEAELDAVDKLLAAADVPEDEPDVDVGGHIVIPGAVKAAGPVPADIAPADHPFAEDATKRQKYLQRTLIHPMKVSDLEALADAVRAENHRIHALDAQKRGQQPFAALDQHPQSYFELNKEGINWERVASKVTAAGAHSVQRTAEECRIRWLGDRHPEIDHSPWSPAEIARVRELVGQAKEGEVDWVDISAKLGTRRTPVDCMRHAIQRKTHVWSEESDKKLIEAVKMYGNENWLLVARHVSEDATASQCQSRWTKSLDPAIKHGAWTPEEDDKLRRAVEVFDRSWMDISTFVPGRNNDQCRDRWHGALNPSLNKTKWTKAEDDILTQAVADLGEGNWKAVSKRIAGRIDNMCRHRWGLLKKRRAQSQTASPGPPTTELSTPAPEEQPVAGPSQPLQATAETTNEVGADKPPPKRKPKPRAKRATAAQIKEATPTQEVTADVQPMADSAPSEVVVADVQVAPPAKPKPKPRGRPRKNITSEPEPSPTTETPLPGDGGGTAQPSTKNARRAKRGQPDTPSNPPPPKRKRGRSRQEDSDKDAEGVTDDEIPQTEQTIEEPAPDKPQAEPPAPKRGKKARPAPPPPTRQSARLRAAQPST